MSPPVVKKRPLAYINLLPVYFIHPIKKGCTSAALRMLLIVTLMPYEGIVSSPVNTLLAMSLPLAEIKPT